MSKKYKKVCMTLSYIEHFLILASAVTEYIFISAIVSFLWLLWNRGKKICLITAWIKQYKSIHKKKQKEHDKIVLLAKSKLNSIEVVTYKALIDSNMRKT